MLMGLLVKKRWSLKQQLIKQDEHYRRRTFYSMVTYEMSPNKKAHPIKSDELFLFFNMFKLWI